MKTIRNLLILISILIPAKGNEVVQAPEDARTIKVKMAVIGLNIVHNRLGAHLSNGQMYVLESDLVPMDHPYDDFQQDAPGQIDPTTFEPGKVRLRSGKRPRPIALRANKGDILEIEFRNLLDENSGAYTGDQLTAGVQIFGLQWLCADNGKRISPGTEAIPTAFTALPKGSSC